MYCADYITLLQANLECIKNEQASNILSAAQLVAKVIAAGGVIHVFGTGHSHMIAEEAFFRAGGLAAINPILDERIIFLKGVLDSNRAEREPGFAARLLEREIVRPGEAAIVVSNSGINAAPIEMAIEMKSRGANVIAITSIKQSLASAVRHASGRRLFEVADVAIDNGVPAGDALISIPGLPHKMGPASTVSGAAIVNSIIIEAAADLVAKGTSTAVFPSANIPGTTEETLADILRRYRSRVSYIDVE